MGESRKNPDGTYKGKWKDFYTRDKSVKWKQAMTSDRKNEDGSYNKTNNGKADLLSNKQPRFEAMSTL